MKPSITPYDAPALIDAHPNLTRLSLYERLAGAADPKGAPGLASYIGEGAIAFAANEYGWKKAVREDYRAAASDDMPIAGYASGYETSDVDGRFVAVFVHLPDFTHRMAWSKAGVPPETWRLQAQWTMMLSEAARIAYVVLADKRIVVYWVDRDEASIKALSDGVRDMARRLEAKDPPPVDSVTETAKPETAADGAEPADLDSLVTRWQTARALRAEFKNANQSVDHDYDAATDALKKALAPGSNHETDGVRIHHNAKTGALTEEKIDGLYF